MGTPRRRSVARMARHGLGDVVTQTGPPVPGHQRLAQQAADEGGRSDIGNLAAHGLQDQPFDRHLGGVRRWRVNGRAGPDGGAVGSGAVRFLQLAQPPGIDAAARRDRCPFGWREGAGEEPAPRQAGGVTDIADAAGERIQGVDGRGVRRFRPDQRHSGVVGSGDRKAARLARAVFRQHPEIGVHRLRRRWIIRRHEHIGRGPGAVCAGSNDRRRLSFEPFQRRALDRALTPDSPGRCQRREHAVGLRRPVGRLITGAARGAAHAGQKLDLEHEAHWPFSSSPPSPPKASARLLRTISTSLSCGVSVRERKAKPASSACRYASR